MRVRKRPVTEPEESGPVVRERATRTTKKANRQGGTLAEQARAARRSKESKAQSVTAGVEGF